MKESDKPASSGFDVYSETVVLETPIVTITAGPVSCRRNGRKKEFYRFNFPEWVNIVALTPERKIILIKQFRYGTERQEIEIPGGMVNEGEHPLAAGCRELLEETGYAGRDPRIIGKVCPNPAIQRNYCYTVLVEDVERVAAPNFDEMEEIACSLHTESEVRHLIASGEIDHGLVLNAMMHYFGLRG